MANNEFDSRYLGDFRSSSREKALYTLAANYYTRTEAYDKTVCSGKSPVDGSAIPIGPYEARAINRHAQRVKKELMKEFIEYNFTTLEVQRAISRYPDS